MRQPGPGVYEDTPEKISDRWEDWNLNTCPKCRGLLEYVKGKDYSRCIECGARWQGLRYMRAENVSTKEEMK